MAFDRAAFQFLHGFAGASRFTDFLGIFFAEYAPYAFILAFFVFVMLGRDWRAKFYAASAGVFAAVVARGILTETLRLLYARSRPFVLLGFEPLVPKLPTPSFPSGHAAVFFALAALLLFLRRMKWGMWFLVGAVLIGVARVFVGVHWPSDVLAGAVVGVIGGWLAVRVLERPPAA